VLTGWRDLDLTSRRIYLGLRTVAQPGTVGPRTKTPVRVAVSRPLTTIRRQVRSWDSLLSPRFTGRMPMLASQECAGVIRNALECARGFSVLSPSACKCAQMFDTAGMDHDGLVRWNVLE
jgi:hypothetical protein